MEPQSLRTDDQSFEQVLEHYAGMVYRLALAQVKQPSDAEDINQDVFLRYVDNRPAFQSEEHRKAWRIRVTINSCKKRWRSVCRRRETELLQQETVHFDAVEEQELFDALGMRRVPYRRALYLFYYEDMSIAQISQVCRCKPSTVRTQLTRGRRQLKQILQKDAFADETDIYKHV